LIDHADFVHQDEPNRCKIDKHSEAQPVLQRAFAKRTIAWLDSKQKLTGNGGCDDATGEASFEVEACDQSRRTRIGCRRSDFLASGGRIRGGRTDSGRAADAELCADSSAHARRRRDLRRQSRHVPFVRQGEHWRGQRRRTDGLGLPMRRLQRLPRLRRVQSLPLRRMRGLRFLLCIMGYLPPLLIRRIFRTR